MVKETAVERAEGERPQMVRQAHGGSLLSGGVRGNKGGGRPPYWLKTWCDALLAHPQTRRQVKAIMHDKDHPAFRAMWCAVADRAHGKPRRSLEVESGESLSSLVGQAFNRHSLPDRMREAEERLTTERLRRAMSVRDADSILLARTSESAPLVKDAARVDIG